ncbi:unnamed protein product [Boreogadus saida]
MPRFHCRVRNGSDRKGAVSRLVCGTPTEESRERARNGYGRKFAHFTEEGKSTLRDNVPPVFRKTKRKRTLSSCTVMPLDSDEDHAYNKRPYSFPSKEMGSGVTMDKDAEVSDRRGIRNQKESQTGRGQEPAGKSDRRGSGTGRTVSQAGIRNRQESQTGRGSITGKQGRWQAGSQAGRGSVTGKQGRWQAGSQASRSSATGEYWERKESVTTGTDCYKARDCWVDRY